MADAVQVFPPGFRVLDAQGNPVSGAKIKFYESNGITPRNVYSDAGLSTSLGSIVYTRSDGYPVANAASSTVVPVYTGTGTYVVEITTSSDVPVCPAITAKGALDTSTFLTSSSTSTLSIPVTNTSAPTLAVGSSHRGKLLNVNTSGGNVTHTLDSAVNLGDGWSATFRKKNASNIFTIQTTGGELIDETLTAVVLKDKGDLIEIGCDGTAFYIRSSRIRSREKQIGDIRLCPAGIARTGELACDGASYLRTDYPDLYAFIANKWGTVDATHFNVPYFNGRVLRIRDNGAGVDPDASSRSPLKAGGATGDNIGSGQDDAVGPHKHKYDKSDAPTAHYANSSVELAPKATYTSTDTSDPNAGAGVSTETRMKNAYVGAYILATTY